MQTRDEKTAAAKVKNEDAGKILKTQIQEVLEVENKKLVEKTNA
jgi:hypothetical protein